MQINQIGGYEIIELVGEGGQGSVYRAQDPSTGQTVAIKILSHSASDGEFLDRFQREASIMATIKHPNVVQIYDHGEEEGRHYIVTEFVSDNLEKTLKRRTTLPLSRAVVVAQQIASALEVSHNAGITHRDIKPANVLINDAGEVKLTDFGIASAESLDSMTSENTTVGTPLYMSPEQIQGSQSIDGRSDLYSLGCLFYETLTGFTPFQGASTYEIFDGHIKEPSKPISEYLNDFPELLDTILERSLTKEREDRYQTAGDLIKDLGELTNILARGPSEVSRTRVMPKILGTQRISTGNTPKAQVIPKWIIPVGSVLVIVIILAVGGFLLSVNGNSGNIGAAVGIASSDLSEPNKESAVESLSQPTPVSTISSLDSSGNEPLELGQNILSVYAVDNKKALGLMVQSAELNPEEAMHFVFEMHQTNKNLTTEFLIDLGENNPETVAIILNEAIGYDLPVASNMFIDLIGQNEAFTLQFLNYISENYPGASNTYQDLLVQSIKEDHESMAAFIDEIGRKISTTNNDFQDIVGNSLIRLISEDMETAIDLFVATHTESMPVWIKLVRFHGDKSVGALFVVNHKTARPEITIDRLSYLIEEEMNASGLLFLQMSGEDPSETSLILRELLESDKVSEDKLVASLLNASYSGWEGSDYRIVEDVLNQDPAYISLLGRRIHPQIWIDMEIPWPGMGEYGKGIWSNVRLDQSSAVYFGDLVVKTLDPLGIEDAVVRIRDIDPPVPDQRAGRYNFTHFSMETDGFYADDLSAVLSFDLPAGHFLAKDYDAHPWSVQLSRYDDSSQTWNPIPANTYSNDVSISENINSGEFLTFSVPIADLSREQNSIWSITTARLGESPILGETLRLEDISVDPIGRNQVQFSGRLLNQTSSPFMRDVPMIIDSVPEYTDIIRLKRNGRSQLNYEIFVASGYRRLNIADQYLEYENTDFVENFPASGITTNEPTANPVVPASSLEKFLPGNSLPTNADSEIKKVILMIPSVPDLLPESDTGFSDFDDLTSAYTPEFDGTADADILVVLLGVNGEEYGRATSNSDGYWTITADGITEGSHMLFTVAEDGYGNQSGSSDFLRIAIDRTPPKMPNFSSDSLGGYGTLKANGKSEPKALIEMWGIGGHSGISGTSDLVFLTSTIADSEGRWDLDITGLRKGDHRISQIEIDLAGNRSEQSEFRSVPMNNVREAISASDIISSYVDDASKGLMTLKNIRKEHPQIAGALILDMWQSEPELTLDFLKILYGADIDEFVLLINEASFSDLNMTAEMFERFSTRNSEASASFLFHTIQSHPDNRYIENLSQLFNHILTEADVRSMALLLDEIGERSFNASEKQEDSIQSGLVLIGNILENMTLHDFDRAIVLLNFSKPKSLFVWQKLITLSGKPTVGALFIESSRRGNRENMARKLADIINNEGPASSLLLQMSGEDAPETSRILRSLDDTGIIPWNRVVKTIMQAAYGSWNGSDYDEVEEMMLYDSDFLSMSAGQIDPQILLDMKVPTPGMGDESTGFWYDVSLEHYLGEGLPHGSGVLFGTPMIKTSSDFGQSQAGIIIREFQPPFPDNRPNRQGFMHFEMETFGLPKTSPSFVLVFELPKIHFQAEGYDAHVWSVQLSWLDEDSKTYNPIVATTINGSDFNDGREERISFMVPIADMGNDIPENYESSIWSISTSNRLGIGKGGIIGNSINVGPIHSEQIVGSLKTITGTIKNDTQERLIKDVALVIDGIPEFVFPLDMEPNQIVEIEENIIAGIHQFALGNMVVEYSGRY